MPEVQCRVCSRHGRTVIVLLIDHQIQRVLDQDGNLYGTTYGGGADNYGTAYKLSPGENGQWTETVLHSFAFGDRYPSGTIALDAGNIYGTTELDGSAKSDGAVFELLSPVRGSSYKQKILWKFNGADGRLPFGGLTLDSTDNLYGTTEGGGSKGYGVVFEVTP